MYLTQLSIIITNYLMQATGVPPFLLQSFGIQEAVIAEVKKVTTINVSL